MKKLLFIMFICCFLFIIEPNVKAFVDLERVNTHHTYKTEDGVSHTFWLYKNRETGYPVFLNSFLEEVDEYQTMEIKNPTYTEEELEKVLNYIFFLTEGKSFLECGTYKLIGIQVLIWKLWSEKTGSEIRYNFDVGYSVDYEKKVSEILETYWNPEVYSYHTTLGEAVKVNFLPFFQSPYQIIPLNEDTSALQMGNEFLLNSSSVGEKTFRIESDSFLEDVSFYQFGNTELVELRKRKEKDKFVKLIVEEKKEEVYKIHSISKEGIKFHLSLEEAKNLDTISFSYELEEGYELENIRVMTSKGKEISVLNSSFVMPKDDVIIEAFLKKKENPSYDIYVVTKEGIDFFFDLHAKEHELVKIEYQLMDGYTLDDLTVVRVSGKKVFFQNNQFEMPNEPVVVEASVSKKKEDEFFDIFVKEEDGILISTPKSAKAHEKVELLYQVSFGYQLEQITVTTLKGEEVEFQNGCFLMPEDSVVIGVKLKKDVLPTSYAIYYNKQKGINLNVVKQAKAKENVSISYQLEDGYVLNDLRVFTLDGKEVSLVNDSFLMPDDAVIIEVSITKEQKDSSFDIYVKEEKGVSFQFPLNAKANEDVSFTYQVQDGFSLRNVSIKTSKGVEIPVSNNHFIMPEDVVFVEFFLEENEKKDVPKYSIFVEYSKGIQFVIPKNASAKDKVFLSYFLENGYELEEIKIETKDKKEIKVKDNYFFMPDEDVYITFQTKTMNFEENENEVYSVPNTKLDASSDFLFVVVFLFLGFLVFEKLLEE